ncbi:DNA cytosine methyltransferase, partial [Salmonella enterica subsp. enterica serovar Paratyphi A]
MNVAVRPHHLDILSICTGGAGLDLGVELAIPGARSVCMVEREAFAVAHLVSAMEQGLLHPAPVWSDARSFDGRRWRGCVDGLIGGIPCQPHSLAGRKQGSLDERDLWQPTRRIIAQSGVWFVLIENVSGMLAAGADEVAGAERIWRDLRKLGFAVEIGLFTAAEVGASHERERVFILAVADPSRKQRGARRYDARGA